MKCTRVQAASTRLSSQLFLAVVMLIAFGCGENQTAPLETDRASGFNPSPSRGGAAAANGVTLVDDEEMVESDLDASIGNGSDAGLPDAQPDVARFEIVPYAVETRVGQRRTPAGLENRITCQVLDQVGEPIADLQSQAEIYPDNGFERFEREVMTGLDEQPDALGGVPSLGGSPEDDVLGGQPSLGGLPMLPDVDPEALADAPPRIVTGAVGFVARDYEVACAAPTLGLRDPSPAVWTVKPGPAYLVTTRLNVDVINAGEAIEVSCRAFDEYGNRTEDDEYDVTVFPPPRQFSRRGATVTIEGSGRYEVQCELPGAQTFEAAPVEIRAGLPAALSMTLFPDRPIYRTGSVIEVIPQVTDLLGNPVEPVRLTFSSEPPLPTFGEGRFLANEPGEYVLTTTVTSPTHEDVELIENQNIVVAFDGPGIDCVSPEMGEVIVRRPGQLQMVSGRVTQVNDLRTVTVDGQVVPHNQDDGRWRVERPVTWGLNLFSVEVDAGDDGIFTTFCAFYASERFGDGTQSRPDMLVLRMGQSGFDDGAPNRPLQSIGDVLRRVLNSPGLQTTVDEAAMAQNPLVPKECRARVFGACIFRLGVDYKGYENRGPNDINIDLVDGGLRLRVSFRDQHVRAKFTGSLGNTARVRASEIVVDMTFDARLGNNGQPDIRLRSLNEVSVGRLSADFSGLLGFVFELVFNAFRGLIERTVTDALRGFVESNIDRVLTDVFGNIELGDLGAGFDVPGLNGSDAFRLTLNGELSRLDFTDDAVLIGLATQVEGPLIQGDRGLGLPLLPGEDDARVQNDRSVGALVRLTLLNQVLYRLWRAGYFQAQSDGLNADIAAQLPDGVVADLRLPQAPWVTGVDGENRVEVHLGPVSASVTPRGSAEIRVEAAGIVSASVRLDNERDLVFDGVRIERLALNFFGASYVIQIQEIVQNTLSRLLEGVVNRALNDGLPTLPLPEFVIPAGLDAFDLPAGTRLGLRQPRLSGLVPAWILDGNLGE